MDIAIQPEERIDIKMSAINISTTVVWVPVELALPVQNGMYLVTKQTGSFSMVDFVEYKDGQWQLVYTIIAWSFMPLPYQRRRQRNDRV